MIAIQNCWIFARSPTLKQNPLIVLWYTIWCFSVALTVTTGWEWNIQILLFKSYGSYIQGYFCLLPPHVPVLKFSVLFAWKGMVHLFLERGEQKRLTPWHLNTTALPELDQSGVDSTPTYLQCHRSRRWEVSQIYCKNKAYQEEDTAFKSKWFGKVSGLCQQSVYKNQRTTENIQRFHIEATL